MEVDAHYRLRSTLSGLRLGRDDPSFRLDDGGCSMARRTPEGPAVLRVRHVGARLEIGLEGEGADWLEPRVPAMLGLADDPSGFRPGPRLAPLWRRFPALRMPRAPRMLPQLVQIVLQQLVTLAEGRRAWRQLLMRHGEPLAEGLCLPPSAAALAGLPVDEYVRVGALPRQARTIRRLARHAAALEEAADRGPAAFATLLGTFAGVGPWTVQIALGAALGFPDAVPLEDVHLPHTVSWALAGEPRGNDRRMLELLDDYRGQRFRVIRLLWVSGFRAPRRGPKRAPRAMPRLG